MWICLLRVLSLLFLFIGALKSQEILISGQVIDKASHESIIGAHVFTSTFDFGTSTDEFGRYALKLNSKPNKIIISYIGYKPDTILISGDKDEIINVALILADLPEVVIKSKTSIEENIGKVNISAVVLKNIPSLLGEIDVVKSLTLLPGVSGGVEGATGLLVRGGDASQNQILYDGIPIYSAAHLFGFISAFNPLSIKHVELIKGGFSSQYGGRLSSLLKINLKDGNMKKRQTKLTMGLINSSLLTEGPIIKDKLSYMISGRITNVGLLIAPSYFLYKNKTIDRYFTYWVTDLNVKFNYILNIDERLTFSYYNGKDNMKTIARMNDIENESKLKWGNNGASLRYQKILKNDLFLNIDAAVNKYKLKQLFFQQDTITNEKFEQENTSSIREMLIKAKIKVIHNSYTTSIIGVEVNNKNYVPIHLHEVLSFLNSNEIHVFDVNESLESNNLSGFVENSFKWNRYLKTSIGLRANYYFTNEYTDLSIEPRFSLFVYPKIHNVLKFSYDRLSQPLTLQSTIVGGYPGEKWLPAINEIGISKSHQFSLGYALDIPRIKSFLSVEAYYKRMTNISRPVYLTSDVTDVNHDWRSDFNTNGKGQSYGLEVLLKKDIGRFSGWLGYTLSRSEIIFEGLNNGHKFLSDFDRTHDIEFTGSYQINKKWKVASTFVYQTGRPISLPDAVIEDVFGGYIYYFSKLNSYRTDPNHRLDITFTKSYFTKRGRSAKWHFGIYNVYGHNNGWDYYGQTQSDGTDEFLEFSVIKSSYLNFIPSLGYSIKF